MLPPIKYKVHPKMAQIMEEKRKRKEILMQARQKQQQERYGLKEERKQYMEENKKEIQKKVQQIYQKKVVQHNRVREEDQQRAAKIAIKKAQRLMQLIPERRALVQMFKESYLQNIQNNDLAKQEKLKQLIEARIIQPQAQFKLEEKVRQHNLIDTNDGTCVICLTSEAHFYMTECKHLISCKDCEFILRLQKKCPLCRRHSGYADLKAVKRKRKASLKK